MEAGIKQEQENLVICYEVLLKFLKKLIHFICRNEITENTYTPHSTYFMWRTGGFVNNVPSPQMVRIPSLKKTEDGFEK